MELLVIDSSARPPSRIPQAHTDDDGYSMQSTCYPFKMIETDISTCLDELHHRLAVARGVHVSVATISPILSRMGVT